MSEPSGIFPADIKSAVIHTFGQAIGIKGRFIHFPQLSGNDESPVPPMIVMLKFVQHLNSQKGFLKGIQKSVQKTGRNSVT